MVAMSTIVRKAAMMTMMTEAAVARTTVAAVAVGMAQHRLS